MAAAAANNVPLITAEEIQEIMGRYDDSEQELVADAIARLLNNRAWLCAVQDKPTVPGPDLADAVIQLTRTIEHLATALRTVSNRM